MKASKDYTDVQKQQRTQSKNQKIFKIPMFYMYNKQKAKEIGLISRKELPSVQIQSSFGICLLKLIRKNLKIYKLHRQLLTIQVPVAKKNYKGLKYAK